ncbi:ROK family protein [Kitasatospora sp. GP82]|uniref:ROK family protein n=1 Tax=Kitasatospora sp. GP82 TaxID=3035089 RepID=UPI002476525C|nr:ROK family protein [Kitasatospora sp. GP82]MDH6130299.1 3-dehydroquinate synthetase/predicted NBD/HSP70 family sugar kinase [Kitasatospora sp. GP82]
MMTNDTVTVFDVGGTHARSAVLDGENRLHDLAVQAAPSWTSCPGEGAASLHQRLVDLIVADARRLARRHTVTAVGVSLGVAIDARTGMTVGSGPLWGDGVGHRFDTAGALRDAAPEFRWTVVNDVTATAVALAAQPDVQRLRRLAAVIVGSGIGLRTIEVGTGRVPVSADTGLQGEIGHLPAEFRIGAREIVLPCDCGATGHLSAYASGRGIDRILKLLAAEGTSWLAADAPLNSQFAQAVAGGEREALTVLEAVTRPLAHALLSVLSTDAEIDRVVLTGGVPAGLGSEYLACLTAQMDAVGLYGRSGSLADRIQVVAPDAEPALQGAGMLARSGAAGARSWIVPGDNPKSYSVVMAPDMLASGRSTLRAAAGLGTHGAARRLVVADKRVWELYGDALTDALTGGSENVTLDTLLLELDESCKNLAAVSDLVDAFDRFGLLRRSEPVIAVGGGVLLDLASFTAGIYRRGVPLIKVPTTLLGMIDAGIGVKTAINYGGHKSRLGTYSRPSRVVIDPGFLRTLDPREYRCGLGESIKIAVVADAALFDLLDTHSRALAAGTPDPRVESKVIERSIAAMLGELVGNLSEDRLDRLADIGHAFSGALEMSLEPTLLHGEAVAIDLAVTVMLSRNRGLLPSVVADRVIRVLTDLGLPTIHREMTLDLLVEALAHTSLHRDGRQRLPLLEDVGRAVFVNDVTEAELGEALAALQAQQLQVAL